MDEEVQRLAQRREAVVGVRLGALGHLAIVAGPRGGALAVGAHARSLVATADLLAMRAGPVGRAHAGAVAEWVGAAVLAAAGRHLLGRP